jgi:hypothetical protein
MGPAHELTTHGISQHFAAVEATSQRLAAPIISDRASQVAAPFFLFALFLFFFLYLFLPNKYCLISINSYN